MNQQTLLIVSGALNVLYILATLGALVPGRFGAICNTIGLALRSIFGLDKGPIVLQLHSRDAESLRKLAALPDGTPQIILGPNVSLTSGGQLRVMQHQGTKGGT